MRSRAFDLAPPGRFGVPFAFDPHFPVNTLALMRGAAGLQLREPQRLGAYLDAVFHAMWVDAVNLDLQAQVARVLGAAGFDAGKFAPSSPTPR